MGPPDNVTGPSKGVEMLKQAFALSISVSFVCTCIWAPVYSASARPAPADLSISLAPEEDEDAEFEQLPLAFMTGTVTPEPEEPETCLSEEEFKQELQALLAQEASGLMDGDESCDGMGSINDLDWALTDGDRGIISSGLVHQERNVPAGFNELSNSSVSQCTEPESIVPVLAAEPALPTSPPTVYPEFTGYSESGAPSDSYPVVMTHEETDNALFAREGVVFAARAAVLTGEDENNGPNPTVIVLPPLPTGAEDQQPDSEVKLPPLPVVLPPLPSKPPADPSPGPRPPLQDNRKVCCSYGFSPNDGNSPGGDSFCQPHAEQFDWAGADCDEIFNCRLRQIGPTGQWVFKDCYNRSTRQRLDDNGSTLEDAYMKLGCTDMKHVTLHHSNPIWGPRDCQALVNCLPERPGQNLNLIHHQLGCSTFGDPGRRCGRAQALVRLFKRKCNSHGRVRLVITGKQTDLWIPSGSNLGCSWKNPTGFCYSKNAPYMRKLVITPDGFIACNLVNGKWQPYPSYCGGRYSEELTRNPDRPSDLRC